MRIHLAIFLMALPLTAQCFTEQELQHKKDVLSEVSKIADEADSSLPPCIGLDRLSETALKQAPPKTCTLAFAFYSSLVQLDGVIRASCRKIAKFTEDTIQSPKYCKRDIKLSNKIKRQLVKFKWDMQPQKINDRMEAIIAKIPLEAFDGNPVKGEFMRMECELPAIIGLQLRKKALSLATKHLTMADQATDDFCDPQDPQPTFRELYLRFLRGGEKAMGTDTRTP